jgi:hypothetical protein
MTNDELEEQTQSLEEKKEVVPVLNKKQTTRNKQQIQIRIFANMSHEPNTTQ